MTYELRKAKRSEAKPLIGLYAQSGAGKTYSALVLARGFIGPDAKICMIETEAGRGEAYADPDEYPEIGGYEVIPMRTTFSSRAYGEAIETAEKAKVDALIIDSASHEWNSIDGVLGMAAKNEAEGKRGPMIWQRPKIDHKQNFVLPFTQTPIPLVILCMRGHYPMKQRTKNDGSKEWARSENLAPIQDDEILFEMFIHGWIGLEDHVFHMTKCTSVALQPLFGNQAPITAGTGEQMAAWAGGKKPKAAAKPQAAAKPATGDAAILTQNASLKAEDGTVALQDFWRGLSGADKKLIKADMDKTHKPRAKAVDARLAEEGISDETQAKIRSQNEMKV